MSKTLKITPWLYTTPEIRYIIARVQADLQDWPSGHTCAWHRSRLHILFCNPAHQKNAYPRMKLEE